MTNTLLSKFDDEMSKPHTDTEDRIHNWLVDNQDDQELMEGLEKNLEPKRTIKGAMDYAIYKASQQLVRPRTRAMGSMVDDSVAYAWFLEKLENHSIGIIVFEETNNLCLLKKCKKKKLSIGTQTLLLESFARSAARDAKKLYDLEIKKLPKEKETSHENS